MTHKPDGGPAFPGTTSQPNERGVYYPVHHQGMSLRDWFAGQALAGMGTWSPGNVALDQEGRARWAYAQADAMIAARSDGGADDG